MTSAPWPLPTLRRWRRAPGWTAAVLATLALGVGAATAIFSAFDVVVLRPLPFPGSARIVALCETAERVAGFCVASPANVEDWARASRTLDRFGVGRDWPFVVAPPGGERSGVRGGIATGGLFELLGARAEHGRLLADADLAPGRERVALLSWGLWSRAFGGDPGVVGRSVTIDDRPATVVGVLARESRLAGFEAIELWMPLTATPDDVANRAWRGFAALGRLAPGATLASARDELAAVRAALEREHPATNAGWGLEVRTLRDRIGGALAPALTLLLAAVGLLLAVAVVNVGHLMAARAASREVELAVRAALGGGRRRLARQILGEAAELAAAGALAGVALAAAALQGLRPLLPAGLPRAAEIGLDARVLAFAVAVAAAATLGAALPVALAAGRSDPARTLRAGRGDDARRRRGRDLLVVAEVALALVLLAGAALVGRGFAGIAGWRPAMPIDRLSTLSLGVTPARAPRGADAVALFERVAAEVAALPGVEATALASAGPLFGGVETASVAREGAPPEEESRVRWFDVSPGLFAALGRPIVAGRDLAASDGPGAPPVAIVNRTLASRLWPGGDPLGRRVRVEERTLEVVGVVDDLPSPVPGLPLEAEIHWPQRQSPRWGSQLVVRTAPGTAPPARAIAARIAAVDPALEAGAPVALGDRFAATLVRPRFALALVAAFAAVAAALAAIGTYGVLSFRVARRGREIGVRLALGATPGAIERAVTLRGLALAGTGAAAGLAGAAGLGRLLAARLPGVPALDLAGFAAATLLLLAVAIAAAWIPARRAARTDPAAAARAE